MVMSVSGALSAGIRHPHAATRNWAAGCATTPAGAVNEGLSSRRPVNIFVVHNLSQAEARAVGGAAVQRFRDRQPAKRRERIVARSLARLAAMIRAQHAEHAKAPELMIHGMESHVERDGHAVMSQLLRSLGKWSILHASREALRGFCHGLNLNSVELSLQRQGRYPNK